MAKLSVALLLLLVGVTKSVLEEYWKETKPACEEEDACTLFFKEGGSFDKICGRNIDIRVDRLEKRCRGRSKVDLVAYLQRVIKKCDRRHFPGVQLPVLQTCTGDAFVWCYNFSPCSPPVWPLYFPNCKGTSQSPIDLEDVWAEFNPALGPIKIIGFDESDAFILTNTGHNVEVELEGVNHKIMAPGLPATYLITQFHFHWGSIDEQGSEHSRNEKHYPMELHIVGFNHDLYDDFESAVGQPDGVTVLGAFFEIGPDDNESIVKEVVDNLVNVPLPGDKIEIPFRSIKELLPSNTADYFRYSGSFTTPGCDEMVIWTVLTETVKISSHQLKKFRQGLTNSIGKPLVDNFRPVQALNKRTVYKSFQPHHVIN